MSESYQAPAGDEQETGGDRRKLGLAAGAGVLLVAVLGYFVVVPALSGGDTAAAPTTMVKKAPQTAVKNKADAKAKTKKAAAKKPPAQPESYSDLSSRENPFRPLWVEPKRSAGTTGSAPSGGLAAQQPVQPAQPAQPGGQAGGTQSAGGSSTAVGGQRVALMTVYSKSGQNYAQTRVGDVVYTPRVGQVFAVSYKLLAVSGKSATYLYGDEQFTLSVGQEVLK